MSIDVTTEKRFEADIEEFFLSPAGGYTHNNDMYDSQLGVYKDTLLRFIQRTQPKEWKRLLLQNKVDPERKFCLAFNNACDMDGLISVLRHISESQTRKERGEESGAIRKVHKRI